MPEIRFEDVEGLLISETRNALRAAREIPIRAAREGWRFLLDTAEAEAFYSGAYRASMVIGVNELPPIPIEFANVDAEFDRERHDRHNSGDYFQHPDEHMDALLEDDFELGDEIVIGNEILYAEKVEATHDFLITERTNQVINAVVDRLVANFNSRSRGASFGR